MQHPKMEVARMTHYFGPNIRRLRKAMGWSQKDFAKRIGKKNSAISSYENDSQIPTLETIIEMAEVFGISVDELIYADQAETISVKNLDSTQKKLVSDLCRELVKPTNQGKHHTRNQIEIIARIHEEFLK